MHLSRRLLLRFLEERELMARYVMANRRAGMFTKSEQITSREAVGVALARQFAAGTNIIQDAAPDDPTARRVVIFDADPAEIEAKQALVSPDVLIEPEILHYPAAPFPRDFVELTTSARTGGLAVGGGEKLTVTVRSAAGPLDGAEVVLFLRGFGGLQSQDSKTTPASGKVQFDFASHFRPAALSVLPAGGFWSMVVRGPVEPVVVTAPALPADGPLGWWHHSLGVSKFRSTLGRGVKVGVIDSGVGTHDALAKVVDVGAFINGVADPNGGRGVTAHGSHVCGIIGANPAASGDYAGVAPGATLFSARVFPPNGGANQGDIALAIDELSRDRNVDLINMSLGAPAPSQIARDSILDALERGTVCFCAAGNSAGGVEYPARFPEAVAVSALGLDGWGPPGSLAAARLPQESNRFGDDGLYLANFSCFGPEITCSAPGVGVISTVPSGFGLTNPYASMDGTSMASPAACGALAAILSKSKGYLNLSRDLTRSKMAKSLLANSCRDIGLVPAFQGRGLVVIR
jgi:subtilisin